MATIIRQSYIDKIERYLGKETIIVLKPEKLRQEMIDILKDMTKSYETGECLNGEE